jgi:hypothetical protein
MLRVGEVEWVAFAESSFGLSIVPDSAEACCLFLPSALQPEASFERALR